MANISSILEARVDFESSQIYDEYDFKGQSTVSFL